MLKSSAAAAMLATALVVGVAQTGSSASSGAPGSKSQVTALVEASLKIKSLPSSLSPSLEQAVNDPTSPTVDGANDILKSCNPYWTHKLATAPVPCYYGDLTSKKIVVVWGDSNAGMWIPALDPVFKAYGYKIALFGFIGCDTSFLPETSSQIGFSGEWKLCNEWHKSLPGAVRKLKPLMVIEASTPIRYYSSAYNAEWVKDMELAFNELTQGAPKTVRVEIGSVPEHTTAADKCLASYSSNVQMCDVDYAPASSRYDGVLNRDKLIATGSHATLVPTFQWLCYDKKCSPVIGSYLAQLDQDHVSTPYAVWLTQVMEDSLIAKKVLPVAL